VNGPIEPVILLTEPSPQVRLLTLNQPELRNAMTEEMTAAWTDAIDSIALDRDVRALVITGQGTQLSVCSNKPFNMYP